MKRVAIVALQRLEMPAPTVYVPYVHGVLKTYCDLDEEVRDAWTWDAPVWRMQSVEKMLDRIQAPDVLGFSVYVWNFENSARLAAAVKARFPRTLVVFGGPHVPNDPSDFFARHPYVDVCVHGEGEVPFRALLREMLSEQPNVANVRGISYAVDGKQVFTAPAERLKVLEAPGAYQSGAFDGFIDEVRALDVPVHVLASLETSRGCPYSCSFCDWGMSTMSKIRQHPTERVKAELDWIAAHGISTVILNDSNFGIFERDVEIMQHVSTLKRTVGFPQAFYPLGFAKNNKERAFQINRIIHDEGFDAEGFNVNFSLQTLSTTALEAIGRKNIPLENYRSLSDQYARSGYRLTPDLILPLPGETLESFKEGYADLASWPQVQRIRIYPCTILPNAPMARKEYREKWGLVTEVAPLDPQRGLCPEDPEIARETIETVVATNTMSEADVAEAKLYVAVVNALELYGVTRPLRTWVERVTGHGGGVFYDALMRWQLANEGVLAASIAAIWETLASGHGYADQIAWSGASTTWDGMEMQLHKSLAYDALTRAGRFVEELRRFVVEVFGVEDGVELHDLLRYQAEAWVLPGHDASAERSYTYGYDWAAWLSAAEVPLVRRVTVVRYAARPDWISTGYAPTAEAWLRYALAKDEVDSHVVQTPAPRERVLAAA
ncbi:MAG: radical SAM protein [Armatimonadetes bacterium]|nr:radical SAM protein [Armatimonadota bacterium]